MLRLLSLLADSEGPSRMRTLLESVQSDGEVTSGGPLSDTDEEEWEDICTESDSESDDSDEDPLRMLRLLESVQSDPLMLSTLTQVLEGLAETSGGEGGAAGGAAALAEDQQSTLGARDEEVVTGLYSYNIVNSSSLIHSNS